MTTTEQSRLRPIVTVYLNQRLVFDIMAMLGGGLSMTTTVSSVSEIGKDQSTQGLASAGSGGVFSSLFKLDLNAEFSRSNSNNTKIEKGEERTHTASSLFYELRRKLYEGNFISNTDTLPSPGDIIEFSGPLTRNPLVETMSRFSQMIDMALKFGDLGSSKHKGTQRKEFESIKKVISDFQDSVINGGTSDLFLNETSIGKKAIVTIEQRYLNDPEMADLVDREFNILGKVVNYIDSEERDFDLLRKTALSNFSEDMLKEFFENLEAASRQPQFNMPENVRSIPGPVVHILPLAIYV